MQSLPHRIYAVIINKNIFKNVERNRKIFLAAPSERAMVEDRNQHLLPSVLGRYLKLCVLMVDLHPTVHGCCKEMARCLQARIMCAMLYSVYSNAALGNH